MTFPPGHFDRRAFLQSTWPPSAALSFRASPALAQSRAETLLVVQELGPNSLDMQGVGSNQTVNGLAWNCYDRLMTYAAKTLPDGTLSYDRAALAPELAESWQVASDGMSCTFKLRKDATFHDGTPVTAKDVKWSFDRAVSVGGFPTFQMSAGSLEKREQFVVVDDHTFRVDFIRKDKMLMFNLAVVVPFVINSRTRQEERDRSRPVGAGLAQGQRGRRRRLPGRELEARQRDHPGALRQLEERPAAEDQARDRARRAVARHAPRHARARRCRSLDRLSAQGLRSDDQGGQAQGRGRADPERALVHRAQHLAAAVRQRQAPAGDRLGDALRADPVERVLRPRQADVRRRRERRAGGMAAAVPVSHRSRQGEGADGGGGLRAGPGDDVLARRRHRDGRRADRGADAGEPRPRSACG